MAHVSCDCHCVWGLTLFVHVLTLFMYDALHTNLMLKILQIKVCQYRLNWYVLCIKIVLVSDSSLKCSQLLPPSDVVYQSDLKTTVATVTWNSSWVYMCLKKTVAITSQYPIIHCPITGLFTVSRFTTLQKYASPVVQFTDYTLPFLRAVYTTEESTAMCVLVV